MSSTDLPTVVQTRTAHCVCFSGSSAFGRGECLNSLWLLRMKGLMLILVFVLSPRVTSVGAMQNRDTTAIEKYIAHQARIERGEEYREARKVVNGDLNNDSIAETIVLYTIESQRGSNNYVQYLAVFVRRSGALLPLTRTAVGGKSRRSVEDVSIEHNAIQLSTLDYGPKDPSCCPSVKDTAQYILAGRTLRELKTGVKRMAGSQ